MAVDILHTRNFFLRCMCGIYMFAFGSLYLQIPGLYGEKGILPAHTQLPNLKYPKQCFMDKLTFLCFSSYFGLNVSYMMEFMSLAGTVLSFIGMVWKSWCTATLFLLLWSSYLSLYQVGQTFLWFQWDILLLEVGFLTILVAPVSRRGWFEYRPRNLVTMWLIRWVLFRLMFASGVVKLQSGCPTWWGLTALNVHYESQCIPTTLAWYFHQLPSWWHKLCVVATFVIEIPVPFMFFSPVRSHRIFSCYAQMLLQIMIIFTGNYNFFNLLTLTLCLSLMDDVHLGYQFVKDLSFGFISYVKNTCSWFGKWVGFGILAYYTMAYFSLRVTPEGTIESVVAFTREEFDAWMSRAVPLSIAIGAFSLVITIAEALTSALFEVRGFLDKFGVFSTTFIYSVAAICMFGISLVPYTVLDRPTSQRVWPVFQHLYGHTSDFHLTSAYGLFRRMTGVEGRPEVILEGANSLDGPWIEYEFSYKPGDLERPPPFVAPHQPRVDWQLWFAALGTYNQNPWLISLAHRLLSGQQEVIALLDSSSPWRDSTPKYIKASKYTYRYTSIKEGASGSWWKRTHEGDYLPIFTVDHAPLVEYLRKIGTIGTMDIPATNQPLQHGLDMIRGWINFAAPEVLLWGLFVTACLITWTKRGVKPSMSYRSSKHVGGRL
ncbi:lipase maturation factor 2-like [Penaeus japonicus]|uniref:lipase maturation factor 2-like n=1 Tax=Penaeus japonicus TaxID=27405 RepID=UPI001C71005E|nr:lipase maturation factor 2-like [Penaeus japonicus]XP_042860416.1 lipase maturation factor 2-like [Penaeus japonicus]